MVNFEQVNTGWDKDIATTQAIVISMLYRWKWNFRDVIWQCQGTLKGDAVAT